MYLLTLAYRTLDIEDARQKKKAVKDIVEAKMLRLLSWCKRFVQLFFLNVLLQGNANFQYSVCHAYGLNNHE